MSIPTKTELQAGLQIMLAVAQTIHELGEVPSGTLYAQLMGKMDMAGYERMIDVLVAQNLVARAPMHVLKWCGPKLN